MKSILTLFTLFLALSVNSQTTTLKGGSIVNITCAETVKTFSETQPTFIVSSDVMDTDGNVVIESGALVDVDLYRDEPTGLGRPGYILVTFKGVSAKDGTFVNLTGSYEVEGESKKNQVIGLTVGMVFLIPPFNLLFMIKKGEDVSIPSGTLMIARTLQDTQIESE